MRDNIYEEQEEFFQFQCFMKEIFFLQYGEDGAAQGYMPPNRGVAWWYSDVIGAVKRFAEVPNELEREKLLFFHLCYYRATYGAFDATVDDYLRDLQTYQGLHHRQKALKERCRALKWAEHQLEAAELNNRVKANEKQVQSIEDERFASAFWRIPLEEGNEFFDKLAQQAVEYHKNVGDYQSPSMLQDNDMVHTDAWKRKLYDAVKQINKYPISTMLLPVLLVSFIVNPGDYQTLYPRMKQQKSVLPRNKHANSAKDRIETLYYAVVDAWDDLISDWVFQGPRTDSTGAPLKKDQILEQMQKLRRTNCSLRLPVLSPSAVIDKLSALPCFAGFAGATEDSEPKKLLDDLEKYMRLNGLRYDVRGQKRPLHEEILLDVAKLCNANSYVYYQCETIWDQRTREALDRLTTCGAISPRDDCGVEKTDEDYLDLYYDFCCQFQIEGADLNTLAFYKYHDPTLSFRILHEIKYFDQLLSQTSKVMTEITNEVRKEFGVPYWRGEDALSKARKLMIQQNKKWAQDCIEDLISNPIHFEYEGFKRFVEKTNPDILKQIPPELEAQMLVLIFENLLQMVCATVVESIRKYCVQVLHTYLE